MNPLSLKPVEYSAETHKLERFNYSHDHTTTYAFGVVKPLRVREMEAGSKSICQYSSFCRTSPLLVATFGRVRQHIIQRAVPFADLSKNYEPMMAGLPITHGDLTAVPESMIHLDNRFLSCPALIGANCSVYISQVPASFSLAENKYYLNYHYVDPGINANGEIVIPANALTNGVKFAGDLVDANDNLIVGKFNRAISELGVTALTNDELATIVQVGENAVIAKHMTLNLDVLFPYTGQVPQQHNACVPVTFTTLVDAGFTYSGGDAVHIGSCDYVIERLIPCLIPGDDEDEVVEGGVIQHPTYTSSYIHVIFAFNLSNFGKRYKDNLIGSGLQLNFNDSYDVSLLPLLATYKAYFDQYAVLRYVNWETCSARRMVQHYDNNFKSDANDMFWLQGDVLHSKSQFWEFVYDFVNMWYTRDVDFISAHTPNAGISSLLGLTNGHPFASTGSYSSVGDNVHASSDSEGNTQQPYLSVSSNTLNYADLQYLKDIYLWVNKDTQVGRDIAKALRVHGLGKYVDDCKSHFIGEDSGLLKVLDVDSNADTEAATLGKVTGKGIISWQGKTRTYRFDSKSFFVVLSVIVPDCGYAQGIDAHVRNIKPLDFYRPIFDGKYYEVNDKLLVVGNQDVNQVPVDETDTLKAALGFAPLYSRFKYVQNLRSGEFANRRIRPNFDPYYLDKIIDVGEIEVVENDDLSSVEIYPKFKPKDVPVGGVSYLYPTRYPWMGNLERIFNDADNARTAGPADFSIANRTSEFFELFHYSEDNILADITANWTCWEPKLGIEKTFGTIDPDNKKGDAAVKKS